MTDRAGVFTDGNNGYHSIEDLGIQDFGRLDYVPLIVARARTLGLVVSASREETDMIHEVGAFEAKAHFSELLEKVRRGDRVVITESGVPVAVLVPPPEVASRHVTRVIETIREVRGRTRRPYRSVRALRDAGRKR